MGRAKREPPEIRGAPVEIDTAALREQFRALRAGRGLSQADAAALLRVSQATVSSFEHGRHATVRAETLLAVRSLVMKWRPGRGAKAGRAGGTRTILNRARPGDTPACVWCGIRLPRMARPVRFCPSCGGHQTRVCPCGARSFDAWASFCGRCGRAQDESTPRPRPDAEPAAATRGDTAEDSLAASEPRPA